MTKPWLPECSTAEAHEAARAATARWAAEWFGPAHKVQTVLTPGSSVRKVDWFGLPGARVGVKPGEIAKLGRAAAGCGDPVNPRDRAVLEQLGLRICRALAEPFGWDGVGDSALDPQSAPGDGETCFAVSPGAGAWTLYLALDDVALTMARRSRTRPGPAPRLGSFAEAIGPEPCSLSGHLGTATLSSSELATLTRGDVIMLDRARTDPVPLLVNAILAAQGTAKIDSDAKAVRVAIETPISLQARSAANP